MQLSYLRTSIVATDKEVSIMTKVSTVWCGSVNILDGIIEEVHTYEEARMNDFHHTFIFSEQQVEKIDNGECLFFSVEPTGVVLGWTDPNLSQSSYEFHVRG